MKSKTLPLMLAGLLAGPSTQAAPFTWDNAPGTIGAGDSAITGGAGTWDLANGNWTTDAGATNLAWGNTSADEAIFGDTGGTITIDTGSGVTANKLTFSIDGYLINANSPADVLTLGGTTPTIHIATGGQTATIDAEIAGTTGLLKTGSGILTLNGANTYTGNTTLNGGTLVVGNVGALSGALNTTVNTPGRFLILATDASVSPFTISGGTNHSFTVVSDRATYGPAITHALGATSLGGNSTITFQSGSNIESGTGGISLVSLTLSAGPTNVTTTLAPTTGTLTILGNVSRSGGVVKTLNLGGTSDGNAVNGVISNGSGVGATVNLTKTNSSTWTLSGANTYTGATTVVTGTLHLAAGSSASPITVNSGAFLGFTLDSPITSTSTLTLDAGALIKITGTPTLPSYTIITTASPVTGTPTLDVAIPGYALVVDGNSIRLDATGASGFSSWITSTFANGTVPGGQQGENDDPDNDGVPNLLEYAIAGLDPTVNDSSISSFTGLTLAVTKRTPLATDVSYIIETSPDLQPPWTAQVTHGLGNTDPTISHTLPSGGGKLFARLKVNRP